MDAPVLRGAHVTLRPLRDDDVATLVELGSHPEVARWWPGIDSACLAEKLGDGRAFAIESDGAVVGLIEFWEEDDPEYRHAGIDVFLGADERGRGLGTDAVRTLARWLIRTRGHHRLTIDPAAANERAICAYEKVGFRRVGVMRRYERGADGTWHDGLLMDLLADELT